MVDGDSWWHMNLFLSVIKHHNMTTYDASGSVTPHTLNLGIR
jgi:hypothetical protein